MARRATLVENIRAQEKNVLLLDSGDIFQGTPYFNYFGGELEFKLMSMMQYDVSEVQAHEHSLMMQAIHETKDIAGLNLHTATEDFGAIFSFTMDDIHVHDIGTILDQMGVAVRAGHHCAQPIMNFFNIPGTVRASFAFYNTKEEIDALVTAVKKAKMMLS